jgi:ABC-2 type transport system ATP-binding protein
MIVQSTSLSKRFGRHAAVQRLNLAVPEGSAYALIGTNGAGKTTTLRMLVNLLEPSDGCAHVLGVDSRALAPRVLAQIGYVSESQLMPGGMTAGEYLQYLRPFYPTWDRKLERSILEQLHLPLTTRIQHLSHGMRMKLALASALPYRPKLLILDEPFSGLDPLVRDEVIEGLLCQAGEMTMLISSHELAEIESFITHVGFLDHGSLLLQESMSDLTGRLREIRVLLTREAKVPGTLPEEWLQVRAEGNMLSFVDTRFSMDNLNRRIAAVLSGVKEIDVQPIALRAIFTTLARAARNNGG